MRYAPVGINQVCNLLKCKKRNGQWKNYYLQMIRLLKKKVRIVYKEICIFKIAQGNQIRTNTQY